MDTVDIVAEMQRAAADFRALLDGASSDELRGRTTGTRWTNEQLLFHMLFGYLLVPRLLLLVRLFGRLPEGASRAFAACLNAVSRPFHVVNYVASLGGARALGHARMERLFDRTVDRLAARLLAAREADLARGMHFPVGWDPYFVDHMTVTDICHYATQHYLHHRRQLTLTGARDPDAG